MSTFVGTKIKIRSYMRRAGVMIHLLRMKTMKIEPTQENESLPAAD